MNSVKVPLPMHLSLRCCARSKRTKQPCQAPAVTGWTVCRFHGAGGGGPRGERNGNYRDGRFTCEAVAERRELAAWVKAMAQFAQQII
jgi:hypothetical protein